MVDADLLEFTQSSVRSVWALELLLLLRRDRERGWTADELIRELRGSATLVGDNLEVFQTSGLVARDAEGRYRYAPASSVLDQVCERLERAYREKPVAVMKAIVSAPNDKLQTFADAFKLKGDRK